MDDLAELGILSYKAKEYDSAISYLRHCDKYDWTAQLYLGMSYYMSGRPIDAQNVFLRLNSECPENEIRRKAEAAFVAVRDKIREDALKQEEKTKKEEDIGDLEWNSGS